MAKLLPGYYFLTGCEMLKVKNKDFSNGNIELIDVGRLNGWQRIWNKDWDVPRDNFAGGAEDQSGTLIKRQGRYCTGFVVSLSKDFRDKIYNNFYYNEDGKWITSKVKSTHPHPQKIYTVKFRTDGMDKKTLEHWAKEKWDEYVWLNKDSPDPDYKKYIQMYKYYYLASKNGYKDMMPYIVKSKLCSKLRNAKGFVIEKQY